MADEQTKLGIKLEADIGNYDAGISRVISSAGGVDTALSSVVDSANRANDALNSIHPNVDVKVDANIDPAIANLSKLDDKPIEPTINPKTDEASGGIFDILKKIAIVGVAFKVIMNVAGTILDVFDKLKDFTVQPIIDVQDALAGFQAQTGIELTQKQLDHLTDTINNDFVQGLGKSRDEVASLVTEAAKLGIDAQLEDATSAALKFTQVFVDEDPTEVLKAMNTLVSTGLVTNFQEAGDLLTTAFQNGDDKGGDLLQTINKNSIAAVGLGLTGKQFLSLIDTGLKGNIENAQGVTEALDNMKQKITEAGTDAKNNTNVALKLLGLENPAKSGKAISGEYIQSIIDGIREYKPAKGGMSQEELAAALFGPETAKKGIAGLLDLNVSDDAFANTKGAADKAAAHVNESFTKEMDTFFRYVQGEAVNFMSSEQIDMPGKIETLKAQLKSAMDVLKSGGTLGEALEVGFKIQGVDEFINKLQASIGNFIIELLRLIASIQDFLGKDSSGTKREEARLAKGQLAYDLKISNPDEVKDLVKTALDRGVSEADVNRAIGTGVGEMIKSGDIDKAQKLLTEVKDLTANPKFMAGANLGGGMFEDRVKATVDALQKGQDTGESADTINDWIKNGVIIKSSVNMDTTELDKQLELATDKAKSAFNDAMSGGDFLSAERLAKGLGDPDKLLSVINASLQQGKLDIAQAAINDLGDNKDALNTALSTMMMGEHINIPLAQSIAAQIGDPDVQKSVDDFAKSTGENLNDALKRGNAGMAIDLSAMLGGDEMVKKLARDNADTYQKAYQDALVRSDKQGATKIGNAIGIDPKQIAKDISSAIRDTTTSVSNMSTSDLQKIVDSHGRDIKGGLDDIAKSADTNQKKFTKSVGSMSDSMTEAAYGHSIVPDLKDIKDTADTTIPSVIVWIDTLTGSLTGLGNVTPILQSVNDQLSQLSSNAKTATDSVNGIPKSVGPKPEEHAAGGVADGWSWVGEQGPELVNANPAMAVLNNQTSQNLMAAITGAAGKQISPSNNTHNKVTVINNVQSNAQASRVGYELGRELRG